jgi:phosphotransferase system HPr (HPr) family protein
MNLRACAAVAQVAGRFDSTVEFVRDGRAASGMSVLELASLAAESGTVLQLRAEGADAAAALATLARLFERNFDQ